MAKSKNVRKKNQTREGQNSIARNIIELQRPKTRLNVIGNIKNDITKPETIATINWLSENQQTRKAIFGELWPRSASEWKVAKIPNMASLASELTWATIRFGWDSGILGSFINLACKYEIAFIRGDYSESLKLIAEIETAFGLSIWVSKRKLHILQITKGLEAQKEFAKSIKSDPGFKYTLIPYIIHNVSYRAECSVSAKRFWSEYLGYTRSGMLRKDIASYLAFHIIGDLSNNQLELARILNIESTGSLIDYYEAFVCSVQIAAGSGMLLDNLDFLNRLELLYTATQDERIQRVVSLLGTGFPGGCDLHEDDAFWGFIAGDYSLAMKNACKSLMAADACPVENLVLLALSATKGEQVISESDVLRTSGIANKLHAFFEGTADYTSAGDDLLRFAWALDGTHTASLLKLIVFGEESGSWFNPDSKELLHFEYALAKFHPIHSWWIDFGELHQCHWSNGQRSNNECDYVCEHCLDCIRNANIIKISTELESMEAALKFYRASDYNNAISVLSRHNCFEHPFIKKNRSLGMVLSLLGDKNYENCVDVIVDHWIDYPESLMTLPITKILDEITKSDFFDYSKSISFPIICHMYCLQSEAHPSSYRSDAAEDYLAHLGIQRPSMFANGPSGREMLKLKIFLNSICVESTMDSWVEFSSSEDVARERIEICKKLSEYFPPESYQFQSEVKDIVRRLYLKERITEVETSKIYVDIESIKRISLKQLKEDYDRYLAFCKAGMAAEFKHAVGMAQDALSRGVVENLINLQFPKNEMTALLEKMVLSLRDEFTSSGQHGLDGYLSVRIRHGTLEGQFRSPLDVEHLLTQKQSDNGDYLPNEHWIDRLDIVSGFDRQKAIKAFNVFSTGVDGLVSTLKNEWIQVKRKPSDRGRIDFSLVVPEIGYIATRITEETSLNAFIDIVLEYFTRDKLELGLKVMREVLIAELKPRTIKLLTELQREIESISNFEKTQEFSSAIGRARTSVQNTIDRISEWFRLANEKSKAPFTMEEAVSISEACIRAWCIDFTVASEFDDDLKSLYIKGNLPSFVDILDLLFKNAIKHSGFGQFCSVRVIAKLIDSYIRITVINKIRLCVSNETTRLKIENIKEQIEIQPFSASINNEGGTGFLKLAKILKHDFGVHNKTSLEPSLEFNFVDDEFVVEIGIPVHSIMELTEAL